MNTILAALLLGLAIAVLGGRPRQPHVLDSPEPPQRAGIRRRRPRKTKPEVATVASLLTEAAARLRAGADSSHAWREVFAQVPSHPANLKEWEQQTKAEPRRGAVAGARVAVEAAEALGAPIARVLECCARGVGEAEEAASQRRTALAAPASTAKILAWLPLAGLGLGMLLGVNPVVVFTDGGIGTAVLLAAALLTLAGRRWNRMLVARAEEASQ